MSGDLPPSSKLTGVRLAAAAAPMARAVAGEPVNEMRRTSRFATRAAPASGPSPCTTLSTPAGTPASSARSASIDAVIGVHSAGFNTTVLPAARAGPTFQQASISGAFHGVMSAVGPAGS